MSKLAAIFCVLAAGAVMVTAVAGQESHTRATATVARDVLRVVDESGKRTDIKKADLAKLKRVTIKALDHGTATEFEGVVLADVLKLAGVEFGEKLRGRRLASYVLIEAADKYRVIFSLAELDAGFTDKVVILADKRDGTPLTNAGPWQIVAPDEKRAGRWIRQVQSIKVVNVP